jgi:hypothetical protein
MNPEAGVVIPAQINRLVYLHQCIRQAQSIVNIRFIS